MSLLSRLWRWLTLRDAPTVSTRPKCSKCDKPSVCLLVVNFNGQTWESYTCGNHEHTFIPSGPSR